MYVLFAEPIEGHAFLQGCKQLSEAPSTKTGYFLASFSVAGTCNWSRWVGQYQPDAAGLNDPGILLQMAADEDGVVVAGIENPAVVRYDADGHPIWAYAGLTSPPGQIISAGTSGVYALSVTGAAAGSAVVATHIDGTGSFQSETTFAISMNGIAQVTATGDGSGGMVLFGASTGPIDELSVTAPPYSGAATVFAASLDGTGAVLWSEPLGYSQALPPLIPPVATPEGSLRFFLHNRLPSAQGTGATDPPSIATRSPAGVWSTQTFPQLVGDWLAAAPAGGDSCAAVVDASSVDFGGGPFLGENPYMNYFLANPTPCGWVDSFTTPEAWVAIESVAGCGSGIVLTGAFGAGDPGKSACAPVSISPGGIPLSSTCRGTLLLRVLP